MQVEYTRWSMLQNILRKLSMSINDKYTHSFIIIEMWIFEVINSQGLPIFDAGDINYDSLMPIMVFYGKESLVAKYREVIEFMVLNYRSVKRAVQHAEISKERDGTLYRYLKFEYVLNATRDALLRKWGSADDIMRLLMRYAFIQARGNNQWALPRGVYENLIKYYGIEVEGFASPFNSLMLEITKKKDSYCSIFPDTDVQFGSRGSFFDQNFKGARVFMNPPFIPAIIEKINELITKQMKKSVFVLCMPAWENVACYKNLLANPFYKHHWIFAAREHHYESNGEKIVASFNTAFIVFADFDIKNKLAGLYGSPHN